MTTYKDSDIEFGRIVGGIAWPGNKPGYGVIIGEEKFPEIGTNKYHFYLLSEVEEQSTERLLTGCAEQAARFKAQYFYGRNHPASLHYLDPWNDERRRKGLLGLEFDTAPYSNTGDIGYHISILIKQLSFGQKTLHLGESKLAGFMDIKSEDISSATDSDYPAMAALGYAVSHLDLYGPVEDDDDYEYDDYGRNDVTGY